MVRRRAVGPQTEECYDLLKFVENPLSDFDRFFETDPDSFWSGSRPNTWAFWPASEVKETDDHYVLSFDVPGLKKEDVNIEVEGDVLRIAGERKQEASESRNSVRHTERSYGRFSRAFTLPAGIDTSLIEANHEDGVLYVAVPKTEKEKPKLIPIKGEKSGIFKKLQNAKVK